MKQFEIGKTYRVRDDLVVGEAYGRYGVSVRMICDCADKTFVANDENEVRLGGWSITREMCELVHTAPFTVEEIAERLGVKIGEKFDIEDYAFNPYVITAGGLFDCTGDDRYIALCGLMLGNLHIVKRPWNPTKDGYYWYVRSDGGICETTWDSAMFDFSAYHVKNVFETRELAEAAKPEIMAKFDAIRKELEA